MEACSQAGHLLSSAARISWELATGAASVSDVITADPALAPLGFSFSIMTGLSVLSYVLSTATGDFSVVDRLWSLTPPLYSVFYFLYAVVQGGDAGSHTKLTIMTALVCLWGCRLTYNFWRKGGYTASGEDYRWVVLRERLHPAAFHLLNITFISTLQHVLLWALTLPLYAELVASSITRHPAASTCATAACHALALSLSAVDAAACVLFVLCLLGETVADQQQWDFHQEKKRLISEMRRFFPFLRTGLFRYSRHPNFFFEVSLWWCVYLFSVTSTGAALNFTALGAVSLNVLFHFSTNFTEEITGSKYPQYARYQQTTSRLVPWFPGDDAPKRKVA